MISKRLFALVLFGVSICMTGAAQPKTSVLPEIKKFEFKSAQSKTLPGLVAERELISAFSDDEKIGPLILAIATEKKDGYIFRDGRYNNSQYPVQQGEVRDVAGLVNYPAFRISPAKTKASEFVASENAVFIKFPTTENYTVYQMVGDKVTKVAEVSGADGYRKIESLVASQLSEPITIFYLASKNKFSIYTPIAPEVEGGLLLANKFIKVVKYRYSVPEIPYDYVVRYGSNRKYFLNKTAGDKISLIWQTGEQDKIYSSTFGSDLRSFSAKLIDKSQTGKLVAATTTLDGTIYYATISEDPAGALNRIKPNETSPRRQPLKFEKSELNVFAYGGYFVDLEFSRDTLLFMMARKMHAHTDGLNHQGGIAVTYNANTLEKINNYGQTSGHSFDNLATLNSKGDFIAMDLGDNYPRGINLHVFKNYLESKVVYTFKTAHGNTANCYGIANYPEYTEISTASKKFYRWSNDNNTYTELGGIVDTGDGYLVSFCGEPDEKGLSLDNRKIGTDMARNVGFVKVVKNFYDISESSGDEVSEKMMLSKGVSETGGFYTFGGRWSPQKNNGVVWLTKYQSGQSAQHLKTVRLSNGNILFTWEVTTEKTSHKAFALITDSNGNKISDLIDLGPQVRLHRRDEPLVVGNKVILAGGNQADQVVELVVLEVN